MTFTITLDPDAEAVIERRAKRRGITVGEYVEHLAKASACKRRRTTVKKHAKKTFGERWIEVFGDRPAGTGTSNWSEVEAPCDPY